MKSITYNIKDTILNNYCQFFIGMFYLQQLKEGFFFKDDRNSAQLEK